MNNETGESVSNCNVKSAEESKYRYTGQEYDEETDLHNYKARFYDSMLMRFYSVDPAEEQASPYTYCANNPVMFTDPSGKYIFAEGKSSSIEEATKKLNKRNGNIFVYKEGRIETKPGIKKRWWWGKGKELLYDAANDPSYHAALNCRQGGAIMDGNKQIGVSPGESFIGLQFSSDGPIGISFITLKGLKEIEDKMNYNSGMTISHGSGEAYTAAKIYNVSKYTLDEQGLDKLQDDAHELIKEILPELPSYFQLNGNKIIQDEANRKTYYFLRDRRTGEDKDYDVEW